MCILLILEILGILWSFQWCLSIFGDFRNNRGILVILEVLEIFWSFQRFHGYFAYFGSFGDILVILMVLGIILDVQGYISNFGSVGVFGSFQVFKGILKSEGIQVVLEVFGSYWVKWMGYQLLRYKFQDSNFISPLTKKYSHKLINHFEPT